MLHYIKYKTYYIIYSRNSKNGYIPDVVFPTTCGIFHITFGNCDKNKQLEIAHV